MKPELKLNEKVYVRKCEDRVIFKWDHDPLNGHVYNSDGTDAFRMVINNTIYIHFDLISESAYTTNYCWTIPKLRKAKQSLVLKPCSSNNENQKWVVGETGMVSDVSRSYNFITHQRNKYSSITFMRILMVTL